ncbi:40S ribosomal protein S27-like protein [Blastocystis sp. subtype 4]|uniref:40S ribosomal protein S27-like protein n=1 Tax=Blastocystis sp. subtype 4 TaxID=944170 RepID=UPI000711927C|nr:40S ribosomal protein S27-like protein [Blastocystis sp. subtype 4]KNB41820.1 40S ribosomal protein S27-like protein [Blastocystis sp. subtype 4]|eukprot:XP_014525263.1 40S ribosomal protein S27-like protein [Blastocystis sp. subtype 4]
MVGSLECYRCWKQTNDAEEEAQKHKLKRLVQTPNSYFMDVRCPGCFNITTVFSHAQSVVVCDNFSCNALLCTPTGGKARIVAGCAVRPKK